MATKVMRSKETRKLYRIVREYKNVVMVTRADMKSGVRFTVPRDRLEDVAVSK